jgi:purine-nucleoside/S-methyl-5'-thioadenosine phosphorylase / adenosine deaminase
VIEPPLFRWEPGGPYIVAFSTRVGGVSDGPFESLNLGRRTGDDVERVDENRRRLCALTGGDAEALAMNFQQQSAIVNRAERGKRGTPGDALWTEEPGLPVLALGADCLVIGLVRRNGDRPAVAVVHAGWRGLLEGVVRSAVTTLGGSVDAVIGPSIGPCCYEVGPEVAERFERRFVRGRKLDLWSAGEHALRGAGVASVERLDLCTRCNEDLFFSHRRTGKPRGVQGVIALVA